MVFDSDVPDPGENVQPLDIILGFVSPDSIDTDARAGQLAFFARSEKEL